MELQQIGFSFGILILAILWIYSLNPRYCSRCDHGTISPMYQHFRKNPQWPLQRYCLKCFFWINLSEYKCDNPECLNTGTHRIHELGFLHRFLVIKQRKNPYKVCQCGNIVELQQQ